MNIKDLVRAPLLVGTLACLLLLAGCAPGTDSDADPADQADGQESPVSLTSVAEYEGAVRYLTAAEEGLSAFPVLALKGDWQAMGRQYGHLMQEDLEEFHGVVVDELLIGERGVEPDAIDEQANALFEGQSDQAQRFIEGMAQGGEFDLAKAKRIAAIVPLADMAPGCSSMAAWGPYSTDGSLVVGRNWDIGGEYPGYKKFLNIILFQPVAPDGAFALVDFAGNVGFQTGMTLDGFFVDVQNGMHSDPNIEDERPLPTLTLFEFMAGNPDMEAADSFFMASENQPMVGLVMNMADENEDRVYEWGTRATKKRTSDGLIAATNHFLDPTWEGMTPLPDGAEGDWSKERLANLLALGSVREGQIDAEKMMEAFDVTYDDGGATFPDFTVYQVVAVPAERTMWLKAPGYSSWEMVDLREIAAAGH